MENEESQWDFRTGRGAIKNDSELNGLGGRERDNAGSSQACQRAMLETGSY